MSTVFAELARRLRRTDLLLLRAVRRQRARPAIRAKGQFWGSVITDDEVDALLRSHGEIDYEAMVDGLDDAIAASLIFLFFDIISAEPAVSALTCSLKLFFLINIEH